MLKLQPAGAPHSEENNQAGELLEVHPRGSAAPAERGGAESSAGRGRNETSPVVLFLTHNGENFSAVLSLRLELDGDENI